MRMRVVFAAVVFFAAFVWNNASIAQVENTIGWYFDEDATLRCVQANTYDVVTAYLCISNPTKIDCSGFELEASVSGNCAVSWALSGDGINIATPPEFIVGFPSGEEPQITGDSIVICTATVLVLDQGQIALSIGPSSSSGAQENLIYISSEAPGEQVPMVPVSGSNDLPTAWINSTDWPCAGSGSGASIYVKTEPGLIEITNPAGGDVVANITINSTKLDSIVSFYQIPQIGKINGALPDTFNYSIRGTEAIITSYRYQDYFVFTVPDTSSMSAIVADLDSIPEIYWVTLPDSIQYEYLPDDPYLGYHIGSDVSSGMVDIQHAWNILETSSIVVAVIDSGIDSAHMDFVGRVSGESGFISNDPTPEHGTGVAGLIGAIWDNNYGTAGMAQCQILNKKLPVDGGAVAFSEKLADIMTNSNAAIANFSGSISADDYQTRIACDEFYNSNRILVCSAGNTGGSGKTYPAYYNSTVCVGGVNSNWDKDPNATFNTNIDLVAPSVDVMSTTIMSDSQGNADHCKLYSGTSFSSPIVAGAAAVLLSYNPNLYNDDVTELLYMSAREDLLGDPAPATFSAAFGRGILQVGAALDSLLMNSLVSGVESGYDYVSHSNLGVTSIMFLPGPGVPAGSRWEVHAYLCTKIVTFPASFISTPHAWGRGPATTGLQSNWSTWPHTVRRQRKVEIFDITQSGCKLKTYTFKFIRVSNPNDVRWYPADLNNMQFGWAALGRDGVSGVPDNGASIGRAEIGVSPNPFNANTTISLEMGKPGFLRVEVYDIRGAKVATLFSGNANAGEHKMKWDGRDSDGRSCASAVYCIKAVVGDRVLSKSFALVK